MDVRPTPYEPLIWPTNFANGGGIVTGTEDQVGIMLKCDGAGSIIRVIRDDLKITEGLAPASTFFAPC